MFTGILAAGLLSPLFFEATPEVRTAYQSLGKIVEDRPMQITCVNAGLDTDVLWEGCGFGRFGVYNWDVSSLTGRREDVHRRALYHTEYGPFWDHVLRFGDGWRLTSRVQCTWTVYRGFPDSGNGRYWWWQADQALENPWLTPFYRVRRCVVGSDYLYFKAGFRRRFGLPGGIVLTPSVFAEGGNARNFRRVLGRNVHGGGWGDGGASSLSFRLELSRAFGENVSAFVFVEQYAVVGADARDANAASSYRCAHNDLTHGGVGLRLRF